MDQSTIEMLKDIREHIKALAKYQKKLGRVIGRQESIRLQRTNAFLRKSLKTRKEKFG